MLHGFCMFVHIATSLCCNCLFYEYLCCFLTSLLIRQPRLPQMQLGKTSNQWQLRQSQAGSKGEMSHRFVMSSKMVSLSFWKATQSTVAPWLAENFSDIATLGLGPRYAIHVQSLTTKPLHLLNQPGIPKRLFDWKEIITSHWVPKFLWMCWDQTLLIRCIYVFV